MFLLILSPTRVFPLSQTGERFLWELYGLRSNTSLLCVPLKTAAWRKGVKERRTQSILPIHHTGLPCDNLSGIFFLWPPRGIFSSFIS